MKNEFETHENRKIIYISLTVFTLIFYVFVSGLLFLHSVRVCDIYIKGCFWYGNLFSLSIMLTYNSNFLILVSFLPFFTNLVSNTLSSM